MYHCMKITASHATQNTTANTHFKFYNTIIIIHQHTKLTMWDYPQLFFYPPRLYSLTVLLGHWQLLFHDVSPPSLVSAPCPLHQAVVFQGCCCQCSNSPLRYPPSCTPGWPFQWGIYLVLQQFQTPQVPRGLMWDPEINALVTIIMT